MSIPASQTDEPVIPVDLAVSRPARGRRLLALACIALGAAVLASNLGLLAPDPARVVATVWPAGLILGGLWIILARERLWPAELASFVVERGEAVHADLLLAAGITDLQIGALAGSGQLAMGETTLPTGPKVEAQDDRTTLRLEPRWRLLPLLGSRWSVALAGGLPWRLNLRSSTGNLDVDLRDLTVAEVRLRSTFGDVAVTLPVAGGADLDLGLVFGDLTVTVPEGLAVRVKLQMGPLANVEHDERRFTQLAPRELGTPLYAVAAERCTVSVWLGTGDLRIE